MCYGATSKSSGRRVGKRKSESTSANRRLEEKTKMSRGPPSTIQSVISTDKFENRFRPPFEIVVRKEVKRSTFRRRLQPEQNAFYERVGNYPGHLPHPPNHRCTIRFFFFLPPLFRVSDAFSKVATDFRLIKRSRRTADATLANRHRGKQVF